jgi:hypothetical protein
MGGFSASQPTSLWLTRPLGTIFFQEIEDQWSGGKHDLIILIVLITAPCLLMGVLPGCDSWRAAAPVLFSFLA